MVFHTLSMITAAVETHNGRSNTIVLAVRSAALWVIAGMATANAESITQGAFTLQEILPPLSVSSSQKIAQQTPIATQNGRVYIVNIEPGDFGDEDGINLHTVIRQGLSDQDGTWSWTKNTIETNTIYNPWHTSPAVGVDESGFVHVAYNMHNLPWQYVKSDQRDSISSFTFLGDEISLDDIKLAKFDNQTSFKTMGYAAIPGNQITYPAFYVDRTGALYISYRFAAKPAQAFESRTMSAGLAKHDVDTGQWQSLGGDLRSKKGDYKTSWLKKERVPLGIASQSNWTAYHPRLAFDGSNRAYIFFHWREGVAGETLIKPCMITTSNFQWFTTLQGESIHLPVKPQNCSNIPTEMAADIAYNTIGSIAASATAVHVVVSPVDQSRKILTFSQGNWESEEAPEEATELFVDQWNNLWAISTGLNIFRKAAGQRHWESIIQADKAQLCYPKVSLNASKSTAYIYSQSCGDANTVSVHALELGPDS